jgi:hypothetical protein
MRLRLLILAFVVAVIAAVPALAAHFFNATPRGTKAHVTPELLILRPVSGQVLHPGSSLVIKVAFMNLHHSPSTRTNPADTTLGMTPQGTTLDGIVVGHIHGYVERIGDGENRAQPFCIFGDADVVSIDAAGDNGIVRRVCGVVPAQGGRYRVIVDVNTDSHDGVYKAHPQEVPAGDAIRVRVAD